MRITVPDSFAELAGFFCGCGQPWKAWQTLLDYLENFSLRGDDWDKRTLDLQTGEQYVVAYLLTKLDLIEHGGNVGGSWITTKGEQVRDFIREHGPNWSEAEDKSFWNGQMLIGGTD